MNRRARSIRNVLLIQSGLLLALFCLNMVFDGLLYNFGLVPRQIGSLTGIISAPLIHGSLGHLLSNMISLAVLGGLCMLHSKQFYFRACVFITLLSGVLVWCFARDASHIGASGLIFGLWSLLLYKAWTDKKLLSAVIGLVVLVFYGGMVFGLLLGDGQVSFEYHIFGALSGIIFGKLSRYYPPKDVTVKSTEK